MKISSFKKTLITPGISQAISKAVLFVRQVQARLIAAKTLVWVSVSAIQIFKAGLACFFLWLAAMSFVVFAEKTFVFLPPFLMILFFISGGLLALSIRKFIQR